MALFISTRAAGPAMVIALDGMLDGAQVENLETKVNEVLNAGHQFLIFDLAKLSFLSSAGLTVFLKAYRRLQGEGAARFAALQPEIERVFSITGLLLRVEVYPTVEDAVAGPLTP